MQLRVLTRLLPAGIASFLIGCGGGGPTGTPPALVITAASPSGDGQVGGAGTLLPLPLRVVVTRDGVPAAGEIVIWQVGGAQAGVVAPTQSSTGADGLATTRWTLGAISAEVTVSASIGSVSGPSTMFSALAAVISPGPTAAVTLREAGGDRFDPAFLMVPAGTTVIWTWSEGAHDLTPIGAPTFPGDPVVHSAPRQYQFTFTAPGRYNYYCVNHGTPTTGMRGSVIVQ